MRHFAKLSSLAAVGALLFSISANAAPVERPQVAINFDRSIALTAPGRLALDKRIHRAALTVCDTGAGNRFPDAHCVADAEKRAKGELDIRFVAISTPTQIAVN
jgi:UrcA family protein